MPTVKKTKKLAEEILQQQKVKPKPIVKKTKKQVEIESKPKQVTPPPVKAFIYDPGMPRHTGFGMKIRVNKEKGNLYNKIK